MLLPRSRWSQAAVIALTEGTSHPGSRRDLNLLKICAEGKNAWKNSANAWTLPSLARWQFGFWQARNSATWWLGWNRSENYILQSSSWISSDMVSLFSLKQKAFSKIVKKKHFCLTYMPEYHLCLIANCIRENAGEGGLSNPRVCVNMFVPTKPQVHQTPHTHLSTGIKTIKGLAFN